MKKALPKIFILIIGLFFIGLNTVNAGIITDNVLIMAKDCADLLGEGTVELLQEVYNIMKFTVPIIIIVFTVLDFSKAITAGKDDEIKKASKNFMIRIIIGVTIYIIPPVLNFVLSDLLGFYGTCGIK